MRVERKRRIAGFSLVEMVIAIGLLGFAFLAMGRLFLAASEHSKQGRHDMIALNSASEIMERMRAVDFDNIRPLFRGIDTGDSLSIPLEARNWATHLRENLGPTARCVINVYDQTERPELIRGLIEVEILTSWKERGIERTMETSTYIVRMGS